jgi:hypothetical protein
MIYRGGTDLLQCKVFLAMNQKELTKVIQNRSRDHTQGITVLQAFKLVERKKAIDSQKADKRLGVQLGQRIGRYGAAAAGWHKRLTRRKECESVELYYHTHVSLIRGDVLLPLHTSISRLAVSIVTSRSIAAYSPIPVR